MGSAAFIGSALGLSALGNLTGAASARQAARFNAQVAENNAELARRQAEDTRQRGRIEEQRLRVQNARFRGRQAAALAAGGVDLSSGSPLQVLGDSAALGELDALQLRAEVERDAFRQRLRRSDFLNEAELSRARGRSALSQGVFRAGGSLLTAGGRVL